ncbi:MAG: hypothetical protein K2W92_03425 [Alphaproteobacteria bacterium]|nr:hypothetical protein [Alphaproteobacteria bacterium]
MYPKKVPQWEKKGLIYNASSLKTNDWLYNSALTPTPILLNDRVIRVYFGARDRGGVSRIGYVDLNADNPSDILGISAEPVLDIGQPGCFDDNGIILGDIIKAGEVMHMYYVGFQKVEKVKFLAFSGLAISYDHGNSFQRVSKSPVLDRSEEGNYIRAIHTVIYEDGIWKIWYAAGDTWTYISSTPFPNYHIRYSESPDGISFPKEGRVCIQHEGDEYRIGRPRVYKTNDDYEMYYTKGSISGTYLPGKATSKNGIKWERQDNTVGIEVSPTGWDSQTLCYPSLLTVGEKTYMFYNGNNMGADGFGYAVLVEK